MQSNGPAFYRLPADEVLAALDSSALFGLSESEVRRRLGLYGKNELPAEKPVPWWRKLLAQFQNILVILLLVATAISAALWLYERDLPLPYEAIAIFAIVLLNAAMGYIQEAKAASAVAALRRMAAAQARVLRDGQPQTIPAEEVVPGDILLIEEGDAIPADARLISSTALQMGEAVLTGESMPVAKDTEPIAAEVAVADRTNMVFSGASATYGRGRAVVVATGPATEIGRIAGMLKSVEQEPTPLQLELDRVGKTLGLSVVAIAVIMMATIILLQDVRGYAAIFDVMIFGVALAVAAVPEGLPAIVTVVLSIGVRRMAERNAIVRRLSAVETLGSASVIASDKTGTLTRNEMAVRVVVTASGKVLITGTGYSPRGVVAREGDIPLDEAIRAELYQALAIADRANNAVLQEQGGEWTIHGDPTEGALLVAARKVGHAAESLNARFSRIAEVPFSSERKLMSTVHTDAERPDSLVVFTKGSPEIVLARCRYEFVAGAVRPLTDARRNAILADIDRLAGQALRTLGVAFRAVPEKSLASQRLDHHLEQDLVFAGLIGMIDPPRPEAASAVARARRAGIRPIMITGDHPKTALVIAAELGIAPSLTADGQLSGAPSVAPEATGPDAIKTAAAPNDARQILTGVELESCSEDDLLNAAKSVSVYARVNPEHKLRIVRALQHHGATVAMTGDGVNDAPALKSADIGVAMGISGTDVSREAADMVLADDNFATIVAAVEGGRTIFANIRKFLRYLLSSNLGEVMTMFFGVLFAKSLGLESAAGAVFLPLLATQILWINIVTDGGPALALGLDPAEADVMDRPPRPRNEGVITRLMWLNFLIVGAVMSAGTLLVLDASLPGGLIEGVGSARHAQTMAFTTLTLFQLFNVFNSRSDRRSAFAGLFQNRWLWLALAISTAAQVAVVHTPFLQAAFSTQDLALSDWAICTAVASTVLISGELIKLARSALRQNQ